MRERQGQGKDFPQKKGHDDTEEKREDDDGKEPNRWSQHLCISFDFGLIWVLPLIVAAITVTFGLVNFGDLGNSTPGNRSILSGLVGMSAALLALCLFGLILYVFLNHIKVDFNFDWFNTL